MITVTSDKGTFKYTKFQWNLVWFIVWLMGVIVGIIVF